jgi:integrase
LRDFSERWFATTVLLTPKTRAGYRSLLDSRILPRLGHLRLLQVDGLVLREWIADLDTAGLSASRIRQARNVLHAMFELAVEASFVGRNPVSGVESPRLPVSDRRYLHPEQVAALADKTAAPYGTLINTLAYTGVRFGEAAALRRSRVDLSRSRLNITSSLAEVGGNLHFGQPKTKRHRTVVVPGFLTQQLAEGLESLSGDPDALVWTSPRGRPLRYTNFRNRVWVPATVEAGLPGLEIHELRHTAASLMIAAGADPKLVQAQLGHASISITFDIYGHLFPDRLDELARDLDRMVRLGSQREQNRGLGRSL